MVVRYPVETPTRMQLARKVIVTAVVMISAAIGFGLAVGFVMSRVIIYMSEMV